MLRPRLPAWDGLTPRDHSSPARESAPAHARRRSNAVDCRGLAAASQARKQSKRLDFELHSRWE